MVYLGNAEDKCHFGVYHVLILLLIIFQNIGLISPSIRKAHFQISSQMTEDVIFTHMIKIINSLSNYLLSAY